LSGDGEVVNEDHNMSDAARGSNGGGRDTSVSSLIYTEEKSEILWLAHERSHELEQKALEVALAAADRQVEAVRASLREIIDAELRKATSDYRNLLEQTRKDWMHHNEVHVAHGIAHEQQHRQTQEALDKAEKTALTLSNTLSTDVQRAVLAQATMITKDQMAAEVKAIDARISLLERGTAIIAGRDNGISTSWAFAVALIGILLGAGGLLLALTR
jgi:hypothetical protein